jgi:integrase
LRDLEAALAAANEQIRGKDRTIEVLSAANSALTVANASLTATVAALSEIARVVTPAACALTFNDLWPSYEQSEKRKLASWNTTVGRWKHVCRHIGDRPVMATTLSTIQFYRDARVPEITCRKKPTSPTTRDREIELIRRMTHWAAVQRPPLIPRDPLAGFEREDLFEEANNVRRNVIEEDPDAPLSIEDLLSHANDLDEGYVLVAYDTGMRREELVLLEWSWIDRRERVIEIPAEVTKGGFGGRQVPISQRAIDAIDRLPRDFRRKSPWVFTNQRTGRHYHKDHISARFRELQERAGMSGPSGPPWLHDLRRSFITLTRRRGEDTMEIMEITGLHTTKAFTRYNIHARKDVIAVRDRIEKARQEEIDFFGRRRGPQRASAPADKASQRESNTDLLKNC